MSPGPDPTHSPIRSILVTSRISGTLVVAACKLGRRCVRRFPVITLLLLPQGRAAHQDHPPPPLSGKQHANSSHCHPLGHQSVMAVISPTTEGPGRQAVSHPSEPWHPDAQMKKPSSPHTELCEDSRETLRPTTLWLPEHLHVSRRNSPHVSGPPGTPCSRFNMLEC